MLGLRKLHSGVGESLSPVSVLLRLLVDENIPGAVVDVLARDGQ